MPYQTEPVRLLTFLLVMFSLAVHAENPAANTDLFEDRAEELGVDFVHFAGVSGEFYIVEISGPGCGMFDFDNDGDLDLYLIQGTMLGPEKTVADADQPPQKGFPLRDRLYRNDLVVKEDGSRVLGFTDVHRRRASPFAIVCTVTIWSSRKTAAVCSASRM
jgi:hypothetical protein